MHANDANIDDAYHEYLWGEESPRAFARRRKMGSGRREARWVTLVPQLDATLDLARWVPR